MKLQFPLARPTRANGALLPALAAGTLAMLAAAQFALTGDVELPAPAWTGGGARAALPQLSAGLVPPVLREQSIFSPARTAQSSAQPVSPLGAAAVAGSITVRGRSYAVIQRPDGRVLRLPVGGIYEGMRLAALSPEGAVFVIGGKRTLVGFGAVMAAPAPAEAEIEEEQE